MINIRRIGLMLSLLLLAVVAGIGAGRDDTMRQGIRVRMPQPTVITSEVLSPRSVVLGALTTLENPARHRATVILRNTLHDPFGKIVAKGERDITLRASMRGKAAQKVAVDKPMLWSPDDPALYTLVSEVWQDDVMLDRRQHTAGFAAISIPAYGQAIINGQQTPLKSLSVNARDDASLRRTVRLAALAGANTIIPADTLMIDNLAAATDREGLLLIVPKMKRSFGAAHPSLVMVDSIPLSSIMADAIPSDSIIGADGFPTPAFAAAAARWNGDTSFARRYASASSPGTPVALRLFAEQPSMSVADFRPAYVVAELVDAGGSVCGDASAPVTFTLKGEAPRTVSAVNGRACIALSGAYRKGRLDISATVPGIPPARTSIDIF